MAVAHCVMSQSEHTWTYLMYVRTADVPEAVHDRQVVGPVHTVSCHSSCKRGRT